MKNGNLKNLSWKERYTYAKNVPFTEKDLNCPRTKFQIVKFKPHTSIKPHHHEHVTEIFYIQSGRGLLKLNDQEFRCQPDDFFLCEPGDVHEFVNDIDDEFVILIFKTNEDEKDIYWK